jgi:hypothetical protein
MTALEMQFAALHNERFRGGSLSGLVSGVTVPALLVADTYSWSEEMSACVWHAAQTMPRDAVLRESMIPARPGWWWFNKPLPIMTKRRAGIEALLWTKSDDRVVVAGFARNITTTPVCSFMYKWFFNSPRPVWQDEDILRGVGDEDVTMEETNQVFFAVAGVLLAGWSWLEQRILMVSSGAVERHRRKQIARDYDAPLPGDVKVIQLRRAESQEHVSGEHGVVDWSCRWVVGGHWRNQPYKEARKLLYIMPYVKGPADKPLRVPTHTVYAVTR